MIRAEPPELVVRAIGLYVPVLLVVVLAIRTRPNRRRVGAAVVASSWNLVALLALNVVAIDAGWWEFSAEHATFMEVPVDLWIGWALLWGAVPMLATVRRLVLVGVALAVADLVVMPFGEPVVALNGSWLIGEAIALATCLVPGLLVGAWTARDERVAARAALQVVAFAGLLLFVAPAAALQLKGDDWATLLGRPRWHFLVAAIVLAPAAAMALQAVREFVAHGGTPVPLDPPKRLVRTGPYAYVANPMQLGGSMVLAGWGLLLGSAAVVAAAAMAAVFSAGYAAWTEHGELTDRFDGEWRAYRAEVRTWVPRLRPLGDPAVLYVARSCEPCDDVGTFVERRSPSDLRVVAAETCGDELTRITYRSVSGEEQGVAALGRALEHVHLGWAVASWIARLPGLQTFLQLVTDAVGGGPRRIPVAPVLRSPASTSIEDPSPS